jgi:hypothetical protein
MWHDFAASGSALPRRNGRWRVLLDLGSGPAPRYGHEGVDKVAHEKVTHVVDLEVLPWPWSDNSVRGANSDHLVEHVRDLVGFMAELWRVCKDGAEVTISHPYAFNVRADQDPTHVRRLNEVSFFYFDKEWRTLNRPEFGDTDFEVIECDAVPEENWREMAKEFPEEFERACRNQINVISDLRWTLRCRK